MPDASPLPPGWPALSLAEATARLTAPGSPFAIHEVTIAGVATRAWTHAPATMRDIFLAGRAHGARTFLVYEDERATFEAFSRATLALADALSAEGVGRGDRVAIAMRNLPEWPVAFFAALLVGAVATPLNAWWTGPELEYGLRDSGAAVAIVDAERWARIAGVAAALPALRRVLVSRAEPAPDHPLARPLEGVIGRTAEWSALPDRPVPALALAPDDPAQRRAQPVDAGQGRERLVDARRAGPRARSAPTATAPATSWRTPSRWRAASCAGARRSRRPIRPRRRR